MTDVRQIEAVINNMMESSLAELSAEGSFDGPMGGLALFSHFANLKSSLLESDSIPYKIVGLSREGYESLVEKCVSKMRNKYLNLGGDTSPL